MLHTTPMEVLKENESSRNTLNKMVANKEQPVCKTLTEITIPTHANIPTQHRMAIEPSDLDQPAAPIVSSSLDQTSLQCTSQISKTKAREIALERYREKRKRRIELNPHLAEFRALKYSKMKAVANGKTRDAEGKFVKKAKHVSVDDVGTPTLNVASECLDKI